METAKSKHSRRKSTKESRTDPVDPPGSADASGVQKSPLPRAPVYQCLTRLVAERLETSAGYRSHFNSHRKDLEQWLNKLNERKDSITHVLLLREGYRDHLHEVLDLLDVSKESRTPALREDERSFTQLLQALLRSESEKDTILKLRGRDADEVLVLLQSVVDSPGSGDLLSRDKQQHFRRAAHRLLIRLSQECEQLPPDLFITGIERRAQMTGGGFADIYLGRFREQPVALKCFRYVQANFRDKVHMRKLFFRECLIWKPLDHPRILPFLGIEANLFDDRFCMVSPWMDNGSLITYLNTNGSKSLDIHRLLFEIAEGLQYLHEQRIVHGDLRGANLLLDQDCHVLLADFGLSQYVDATQVAGPSSARQGCTRWMAPELHFPEKYNLPFCRTFASDVYSFGCVCIEIYTQRSPFANFRSDYDFIAKMSQSFLQPTRPSLQECHGNVISDELWSFIIRCCHEQPQQRPTTEGGPLDLRQELIRAIPSLALYAQTKFVDHSLSALPGSLEGETSSKFNMFSMRSISEATAEPMIQSDGNSQYEAHSACCLQEFSKVQIQV